MSLLSNRPNLLRGIDLPPEPRQSRSLRKREALLHAALSLFATRGYDATTIEAIAEAAEVATGGFYQHFKSKQQILLVLMQQMVEAFDAQTLTVEPTALPVQMIEHILRDTLTLDKTYAGAFRAWRILSASDPSLGALNDELEAWLQQRLQVLLALLVLLPGARRDLDLPTLSWVLTVFFLDLIHRLNDENYEQSVRTITHLLHHTVFHDSAV
jgi:AcrR family transcriptional regulator